MQITRERKQQAIGWLTEATANQAAVLGSSGIKEEHFARMLTNALMRQPELALCTRNSLFDAVYTACDVGLVPDGRNAAIVPIRRGDKRVAELWPMVGGLATKVRQAIKSIAMQAHLVFEGDEWKDIRGTSPHLVHVINREVDRLNPANLVCAYATVHFPGNAVAEFEVMYKPELLTFVKNNKGPWSNHPLEMFRVRPFKRVLKRLPVTGGLMAQLSRFEDEPYDEQLGGDDPDDFIEGTATEVHNDPPETQQQQAQRAQSSQQSQQRADNGDPGPGDEDDPGHHGGIPDDEDVW